MLSEVGECQAVPLFHGPAEDGARDNLHGWLMSRR
jgi:hypothetical protein